MPPNLYAYFTQTQTQTHKHKTHTKHTYIAGVLLYCKVDLCAVKIIASAIMQLVSIETKSSQSCSLRLRSHCGSSRSCGSDAYWFLLILSLVRPYTRTDMHNIYSENSGASATKVFELVTGKIYEDLANNGGRSNSGTGGDDAAARGKLRVEAAVLYKFQAGIASKVPQTFDDKYPVPSDWKGVSDQRDRYDKSGHGEDCSSCSYWGNQLYDVSFGSSVAKWECFNCFSERKKLNDMGIWMKDTNDPYQLY